MVHNYDTIMFLKKKNVHRPDNHQKTVSYSQPDVTASYNAAASLGSF